jgi:MSHA biogenesis protein MshP
MRHSLAHRASGMGLVAAIFLIMVTALLTVAITKSVRTSADAFALEIMAERALLAAESGAELALNRLHAPAGAGVCATQTWALADLGLPSCTTTVTCSAEVVAGQSYFTLRSAGRCGASDIVSQRNLLVRTRP